MNKINTLGISKLGSIGATFLAPAAALLILVLVVLPTAEAGTGGEVAQGISHLHDVAPTTKQVEIRLQPLDEVEYKAELRTGEPMLYRWSVRGSDEVYYDFHGEPTEGDFPEDYHQQYGEGESPRAAGSFVPTFTGHHGWYWLNIADREVVIDLEVIGYYGDLRELYRGNQMDRYQR